MSLVTHLLGRPPRFTARSVRFLLVVCCLFAGAAVLLSSPVAGAPTMENVTIDDDESWVGLEDDHEIAIEAAGIDTSDGPATVTVELAGWSDDALVGDPDVEILTSGVGVQSDVETDGTTVSFDINDTSEAVIDLEAGIDVTLEHPFESSFDGAEYGVNVETEASNGTGEANTEVTIERLSYLVDGDERFPPSTEFVYRNQTVTVAHLEPGTEYTLFEFDPEEGTLGGPVESVTPGSGATATVDTADEEFEPGWYLVYDADEIVPTTENAFRIQRHELDATPADDTVDGDGSETAVTIDSPIRSTAFDVNVTSADLEAGDLFDVFDGETNGDIEHADGGSIVIRDVEAGEEIPMNFESVLEATYGFEFEATDTGATDDASVAVKAREVDAAFGSDHYTAPVGSLPEIDLELEDTDETYLMIGGDRSGNDGVLTNYFDILHVEGDATIRINTRLLGTNVPSDEVYRAEDAEVTSYLHEPDHEGFDDVAFEGGADDLSAFRSELGIGSLPRPFQADRLRLVAGGSGSVVVRDDGVPDFERPLARSNLVLTDTDGFGNVTTHVAPEGSATEFDAEEDFEAFEETLTERGNVTKGDRLVFEIEADGLSGLVTWLDGRTAPDSTGLDPAALSTLRSFPDGFVLEAEQTNPDQNERVTELDLGGATDGDASLLYEPIADDDDRAAIDRYYLVVDTRESGPFDREIDPGDEFRFRFGYESPGETDWFDTVDHDAIDPNDAEPHFPYFDADADNVTESRLVRIEERSVEYETVDSDGRPIVRNGENGTVSGRTNLAPATNASIQLSSAERIEGDRFLIEEPVEIDDDGRFELTRDLSAFAPGEAIDVEFYADQRLLESRSGTVIGADEPLVDYRIVDYDGNVTLGRGDSLAVVSATVENAGHVPGDGAVELTIENTTESDRALELDGGTARSIEFDGTAELEPGVYNYTIATADGEANGLLIVEEPAEAEPSDGDSPATDTGSDDSGEGGPSEAEPTEPAEREEGPEEGDDDLGFGGVPVGTRHAVGGAALVGGIHVLGHWT